ncbi:hypothetical protein [Aliiglaciecola sp. LCG003]|uniref:hypothetical protein n=1 Tax=Aliiglaciecola sp. LCG003 TaxID=3053655 RepID=UPI0025736DA5|nr:hypothetical protein [Aliiglaciecola sp. LCG003]WJG08598.1 hypothetical protein QR722_14810 [Aliiglaciecola sp. LCG003]
MMSRFIDDQHSIIILSNIGISYLLKQQLTKDIVSILYDLSPPERKNDATLALINSLVSNQFMQTLHEIKSAKTEHVLDEASLSSLAFQLLWSGLINQSLPLFSFINTEFVDSKSAQQNLSNTCSHRLVKQSKADLTVCNYKLIYAVCVNNDAFQKCYV